jgi:hypothetical protein
MDMFSGIQQADSYAQQSAGQKNTMADNNLPRLEELLTGIPTIDEVIRAEYAKLATQKQKMAELPQQVETSATTQGEKPGPAPIPGQGSSIMNSSSFPASTAWWSA